MDVGPFLWIFHAHLRWSRIGSSIDTYCESWSIYEQPP